MACSLNLQKALESCAAFLQEHQSEFLILRRLKRKWIEMDQAEAAKSWSELLNSLDSM
jgi:hypothetical protein